ncbi:PTS lactose/cellobiose transporter subunit IIA [Clostridium saudiense]|uniref:PTS lactose/cellobiose transporter subunit IIA n=1 Tax=Clostridium saudiense TaxID=1414720 RepID=UPI00267050C2|nr:PTS lactose/cellobiose transporter subunit IIA [Clostridium saudiense]
MNLEEISFNIICFAGNARSMCIEALGLSRQGKFYEAEKLIAEAEEELNKSHGFQSKLIMAEADGDELTPNILLIHSQDHLMNAITVKDMAKEMMEMHKMILINNI